MLNTLSNIQASRVVQVANAAPTSQEFISLVNEAVDELMRRGNWWGSTIPMQGCVYDGCVVWPRYVASVLAINNRCRHTTVSNHWFQFMDWSREWHQGLYEDYRRRGRVAVSVNDGTLPVFSPIPCGQVRAAQFFISNQQDAGKTITIYGRDANDQVLWGVHSDGITRPGWQITLAIQPVKTLPLIRIDRVLKDPTIGQVRGYQVDSNGVLYDMALYEPSETSPDYIRTRVPTNPRFPMITALVKLAFIPMQYPDDLCPIENMEAIVNMVYSIKKKESGDLQEAVALDKLAIRSLNYEMRTRYPDEQFQLNFRPFGGDSLDSWRTRIGMI